jgi:hypothetical protein
MPKLEKENINGEYGLGKIYEGKESLINFCEKKINL